MTSTHRALPTQASPHCSRNTPTVVAARRNMGARYFSRPARTSGQTEPKPPAPTPQATRGARRQRTRTPTAEFSEPALYRPRPAAPGGTLALALANTRDPQGPGELGSFFGSPPGPPAQRPAQRPPGTAPPRRPKGPNPSRPLHAKKAQTMHLDRRLREMQQGAPRRISSLPGGAVP
jgi:hypothetical protein